MSNANFAPYQPPPDERLTSQAAPSSSRVAAPSVPRSAPSKETNSRQSIDSDMDPRYATESYQSSVPQTPNSALPSATSYQPNFSSTPAWQQQQQQQPSNTSSNRQYPQNGRPDHLSYSTTHGWSLSSLCFAAWALPPFSSVLLLIIETENVSDAKRTAEEDLTPKNPPSCIRQDLVRFHAYQSGLMGVASVLLLWILRAWFGWYTLSIIVGMAFLGYYWVCG